MGPGSSHTWYTGGTADLRAILVMPSHDADPAAAEGLSALEVGVVTVGGSIRWLADRSTAPRGSGDSGSRSVTLPSTTPVAGIVVRNPGKAAVKLGPPRLDTANFGPVDLEGVLQNQVQSPRWRYTTMIGPFAVFKNTASKGWAWLSAPGADPAEKGPPAPRAGADAASPLGGVTRSSTTPWGTDSYLVDATRSAQMIRSETYLRGWSATLTPVGQRAGEADRADDPPCRREVRPPAEGRRSSWAVHRHLRLSSQAGSDRTCAEHPRSRRCRPGPAGDVEAAEGGIGSFTLKGHDPLRMT